MKKKILIVGGSHSEIPLVKAAKELGLYVITTGNQSNGLAHQYSDENYICDYSDNKEIYQLAKKLQIDYICFGAHDLSYFSTVYTASKLGIEVFDDMKTAQILHHKDKFKKFCLEHNILSPKAKSFTDENQAMEYTKSITFPCIVKPIDMGGGKGISKITSSTDIENSIKNAFKYSKLKIIVIENFFEGSLHSFSTFIVDKKVKFYFEDTEIPCQNNPYGVCTSISPSQNIEKVVTTLISETEKISNLLNLKDGLLHMQYLRNNDEIAIVELTRRMPGDMYNIPVETSTGFEYANNIIKIAIGQKINLVHHKQDKFVSRHCIIGQEKIIFDNKIKKNIVNKVIWGDSQGIEKQGIIFLEYSTEYEMLEKTHRINELINVEVVYTHIGFNISPYTGNEEKYILESIRSKQISGDGEFTKRCQKWFEEKLECKKAMLVPSCTHALEIAAILLDIREGDEVIMPSYTFVSTANAFVLRGATIVFVDIRPDTLNIDESKIEAAITDKTKAIVPVHYAGVACEMDTIMDIASRYKLFVIEDAAQAIVSSYKGKALGTIGHLGAFSFHETKNITSGGEGGLLIINDKNFINRAEITREKGTNRSLFFRGMVDKYSWVDIGSSYLLNDVSAAYLWGQLEMIDEIQNNRVASWQTYFEGLQDLEKDGFLELPIIPDKCMNNAHMFYIKVKDLQTRTKLLEYLKDNGIYAVFHYVPLHSSLAGEKFGRFSGEDIYTTKESERIIRLPMYFGLSLAAAQRVVILIKKFFNETK